MPQRDARIATLANEERELVRQCIDAAVRGPFFPDWEFQTLFGLHRTEVAEVLSRWPDIDDSRDPDRLAINNTLANLVGYPHGCEGEWPEFIDAPPAEVERVFRKWRGDPPQGDYESLE